MKAPDKIYLQACGDCDLEENCENCEFEGAEVTWCEDKIFERDVEYIRKDALLEWAKDFKARTGWYEIEVAMDDLIDKLNSM